MKPERDPWSGLGRLTPARIALGRAGGSLPTGEVLKFGLAHAQARDAVHARLDVEAMRVRLAALTGHCLTVESQAVARDVYLRRPDLGRRLSAASQESLAAIPATGADLGLVIADGLSARAVEAHAAPLVAALMPRLEALGLAVAPAVVALGARVALGDEIGARLGVKAVAVLIGERPGLSSPDSLGVYLTLAPRRGRTDAERNCISNVRAEGLSHELAAFKLAWLVREALRRGLSGVELKDDSDRLLEAGRPPPALPRL
ncbi:MAG: ethanolamine ammonia-lyase subunit EutC [Hyphomicrobiaceae bacterium]|nr:ethanolamine ammonia-lyase subunit EutC [Hyphomicrobiaceae bacterium]